MRTVKKLSNLEIDEVSLVDRPANQHGLVAITKAYQEDNMPGLFDAEGYEVEEADLQPGDFVYTQDGQEFQAVDADVVDEDGDEDDGGYDAADELDYELASVGKAGGFLMRGPLREGESRLARSAGMHAREAARGPRGAARDASRRVGDATSRLGQRARGQGTAAGMQYRAIPQGARRGAGYTLASGGAAYGGAEIAGRRRGNTSKSLSDMVLQDLSKAFSEDDRDQVIAKAMAAVDDIADRNASLEDLVVEMYQNQQEGQFSSLAKGYGLPVDDEELGGLLYRASQSLDPHDLSRLDQLLSASGEIAKSYGEQIGYDGYGEDSVMGQVYAVAGDAVAKSDMGLSPEQAVTALFATNPAAYDEYEAEQRRR